MAPTESHSLKIEDFPPVAGDAGGAILFEGAETTALLESMAAGTASEAYLREADRLYEELYRPEPANDLFR